MLQFRFAEDRRYSGLSKALGGFLDNLRSRRRLSNQNIWTIIRVLCPSKEGVFGPTSDIVTTTHLPLQQYVKRSRTHRSLPFHISNTIRHLSRWRALAEQRLPPSPARPWVPLGTACWVSSRLYGFFYPRLLILRAPGLTIPWAPVEYPVAVKALKTALEQGANFWNGVSAALGSPRRATS